MQIKYLLFCGLFLLLISCDSKDNDPVEPDTSKTTIEDKKETEETTDKKEETTETTDKNTPLTAVVLTAPADGATAIALNDIGFSWDASTHATGDDLTYDVYLDENNPPTTKIASNLSSVNTSVSGLPKHGTTYYWYVTTKDGKNDAVKSEVRRFTTINTPPTAAVLTAPADGVTAIALNNIDFSWDASTDAEGDALTYEVYLGENNPPTTKIASNLSGESTSLTTALKSATTYYWLVTTKDGKGGETKSEVRSFTTIPTAAMLTAPADAATNVFLGHALSWDAGADADGDALTYDVYLDESNPPTTKVATDVTILSAPISLTNAPEGSTTYYWFVTTKDGKGSEINSEVRSFTTAVRPANKAALKTEINGTIQREGNNADLGFIDTSLVTDMSKLFKDDSNFNGDVSKWNTSNVKTMESMFHRATKFNGDLSKWDVSNVENMRYMFYNGATSFNGDLSEWDVSKVTTMEALFQGAESFNGDLSKWNTSNVTDMSHMFHNAYDFEGGDLRKWDVSKVTTMHSMFYSDRDNDKFNGNISTWNVSNVIIMIRMFEKATSFNQDISGWSPTRVTNMNFMFQGATSFNQDLDSWNIASSVSKTDMFKDTGVVANNKVPSWYNP